MVVHHSRVDVLKIELKMLVTEVHEVVEGWKAAEQARAAALGK